MLSIIEYLSLYSKQTPVSKYHIMTKIISIKQQRPDRIAMILNKLEENGYINSINTSNTKFYTITEKGFDAYVKWINEFLVFVRNMNNENIA